MHGGRYERDGRFRGYKGDRLMAKGPELLDTFTIRQDAGLLDKHIMECSADALGRFVRKYELPTKTPMWLLPHISSHYFYRRCLAAIASHMVVDESRVFSNLADKGNTGSAAWLIMLAELVHGGRLGSGDRILCAIPESARFTAGFAAFTVVD
jgi:3-oxoacyl-[acyl-carrier-protein] synthase-3